METDPAAEVSFVMSPAPSDGAEPRLNGEPPVWPPPERNHRLKRALLWALGIREHVGGARPVLLTFDDGPDPEVTPAALRLLREADARAVFFVLGRQADRHPDLVRRIHGEGHVVGNHTYTHARHGRLTVFEYLEDVNRCQEAVARALGRRPAHFRPPEGRLTAGSLCVPLLCGLEAVYWSLDPRDYALRTGEETAVCGDQLGDAATPGDIILLHDVNPALPSLLARLLPRLRERGMDLRGAVGRMARCRPGGASDAG